MLSIILPAYNEEDMVPAAAARITGIMEEAEIPFQILFIDDGSKDRTWEKITEAAARDQRIAGVHFSRNFGKEAAMFAGLERAAGDCCVVLDCDLQHPPEKIVEMYRLWQQGYEVVEGVKEDRGQESGAHRLAAGGFYRLISKATGMDMSNASDFKLLDRKVVDALNQMPERNAFFRALSYWVGFRKTSVSYQVQERTAGQSKWSTASLIRYAVTNIASFSTMPMQIVTWVGILFMLFAVVLGVNSLVQKLTGQALEGFTTVILIQLLACGIIMLSLGIIGFYVARIYEEIQGRPRYIVSRTVGAIDGEKTREGERELCGNSTE